MPTVFLPGTGATMRTLSAFSERMMSLESAVMAGDFDARARGPVSYIVMTGPVSISTTWASMLNSLQRLLEHGGLFADEFFLACGEAVLGFGEAIPAGQMIFAQFLRAAAGDGLPRLQPCWGA